MKSTDRKILILVASLALLLAGCGGGSSSTTAPVDPSPTPAETAILEAETALMNAEDALEMLDASATDEQMRAAYQAVERAANNLVMVLKANGGSPAAVEAATTTRQTAMHMADNLAQKIEDDAVAADAAMTALATKLYAAINDDPLGNSARRTAFDENGVFTVQVRDFNSHPDPGERDVLDENELKEDKTAMLAPLHGWTGSVHTATVAAGTNSGAGTYTAHLYSNVDDPTPGAKFNSGASAPAGVTGVLGVTHVGFAVDATTGVEIAAALNVGSRIASPEFDHTAGDKTYKVPDNPPTWKEIRGSYWGVAGTYRCTYGGNACTVTKAAEGYTLGGGTTAADTNAWTFIPDNPEDRVTSRPDTVYPIYGWWQHEAPDGTTHVSAVTGYRGSTPAQQAEIANLSTNDNVALADGVDLNGTATYKGGAAGMYAISAGANNDAGHFTADVELTATFKGGVAFSTDPTVRVLDHKITGTIDNFMGNDGMSRDWSVALKEDSITNVGTWPEFTADAIKTIWSMGGTAAGEAGEWGGRLYKQNDGGVPTVGTGTFHSEYENIGRMVGAFGVNLEE